MATPQPRKFGYAFGTGMTIFVFILDFLVILTTVSNCIVYNKIASGEPNNDISQGWARFLLAVNVIIAICAFVIFFWILYILFTGKKSIGDEILRKREFDKEGRGGLSAYLSDVAGDVRSRGEEAGSRIRENVEGFGNYTERFGTYASNLGEEAGSRIRENVEGFGNRFNSNNNNLLPDPNAHLSNYTTDDLRQYGINMGGRDTGPLSCSDGDNSLACPTRRYGGTQFDERLNQVARQYAGWNI